MNLFSTLFPVLCLLIGFFLGIHSRTNVEEVIGERVGDTRKKLKHALTPQISTGQIKPKTPEEIRIKHMPDHKKEGLEEMKKTLDASPELAEHRRLAALLRDKEKPLP